MSYDLILRGGEVVHIGRADVAIKDGRIAAIGSGLDGGPVIDVSGRLVTPGLVDLHTHVHAGATYWGIDPDPIAWHTGVTTWVDAGSAGAYNLEPLLRQPYAVRIPLLLNISALGLTAPAGESRDLANCDVDLAAAALHANPRIVGVKVRMDKHNVGQHGLEPLRRALFAAGEKPVMVHIGAAPPSIREMLPLLRPGDIITHCASGIAAGAGGVDPAAKEAYESGVLFDIGHGSGGFAFDIAEAQLEAAMPPHTISSDLHARSLHGPVFDLPTTLAKLMAIGMSLTDVIDAATKHPAEALGLDAGVLKPGAPADIAVFTVVEGDFPLVDVHGQVRRGRHRLHNELTLVDGKPLPPSLSRPPAPWIRLTTAQESALRERERRIRELLNNPLVGPEGLEEQFPRYGG